MGGLACRELSQVQQPAFQLGITGVSPVLVRTSSELRRQGPPTQNRQLPFRLGAPRAFETVHDAEQDMSSLFLTRVLAKTIGSIQEHRWLGIHSMLSY